MPIIKDKAQMDKIVQDYQRTKEEREAAKPEPKDLNRETPEMSANGVRARIVARDPIGSILGEWVRFVPQDQHEAMAYSMGFVEGSINVPVSACRLRAFPSPKDGVHGELMVMCTQAPGRTLQK